MRHLPPLSALAAILFLFATPFLFRDEVLSGHPNDIEVGLPESRASDRFLSRKHSDLVRYYVPEIHQHLHGDSASWLSTWTPHTELGRPTNHLFGLGKAFPLTHVLSWFCTDAFRLYTLQALLAIALAALFGYLLLDSLGLHPCACLAGALGLSLGFPIVFGLSFVVFTWGTCWTLALSWCVKLTIDRPKAAPITGASFALYCLLLSGYPQQIVGSAYLVAGFAVLRLFLLPVPWKARGMRALLLLCAALVGGLASFPVYADLVSTVDLSARVGIEEFFFSRGALSIEGWRDVFRALTHVFDGLWLGHPLVEDSDSPLNGWSLTPPFLVLIALSTLHPRRARLVPLYLFVSAFALFAAWKEAHSFAVRYLGLNLSRMSPLRIAFEPAMILAAYGADALLRFEPKLAARMGLCVLPLVVALPGAFVDASDLDRLRVAVGLLLYAGIVAFAWKRSRVILVSVLFLGTLYYASSLRLSWPRAEIRLDSPLVEVLREETRDGSRFAWVDRVKPLVLPSNEEALLDLKSVHSYDSLASAYYQRWAMGAGASRLVGAVGRRAESLSLDFLAHDPLAPYAGVGVVLARAPLTGLERLRRSGSVFAYRLQRKPVLQAQVQDFELEEPDSAHIPAPSASGSLAVERRIDQDDRLAFGVTPRTEPTVLFVSQQYHPRWEASSSGHPLSTLRVNGFYQGVLLPPGTNEVELRFRPFVRWSFVPQVVFALAGIAFLVRRRISARRGAERPGSS